MEQPEGRGLVSFFRRALQGIASAQLVIWILLGAVVLLGALGIVWEQRDHLVAAFQGVRAQEPDVLAKCDTHPPPTADLEVNQIDEVMIFISQEDQREAATRLKSEVTKFGIVSINIYGPDPTFTDPPKAMTEVRFFDQVNRDNACRISLIADRMGTTATFLLSEGDAPRQLEVWFPEK